MRRAKSITDLHTSIVFRSCRPLPCATMPATGFPNGRKRARTDRTIEARGGVKSTLGRIRDTYPGLIALQDPGYRSAVAAGLCPPSLLSRIARPALSRELHGPPIVSPAIPLSRPRFWLRISPDSATNPLANPSTQTVTRCRKLPVGRPHRSTFRLVPPVNMAAYRNRRDVELADSRKPISPIDSWTSEYCNYRWIS